MYKISNVNGMSGREIAEIVGKGGEFQCQNITKDL